MSLADWISMLTMYSQPGCAPCRVAATRLDRINATYIVIDVTRDEAAAQALRDAGFTGTPVFRYKNAYHTMAGLPAILADLG